MTTISEIQFIVTKKIQLKKTRELKILPLRPLKKIKLNVSNFDARWHFGLSKKTVFSFKLLKKKDIELKFIVKKN